MQVSQVIEQEEFAVIGGGEARAFQIGNSAQAFKILSDSLYSNKQRAVVREVLCNAVDAHIEAGIPERPVEIGLSDCELTIQDFGPGIPDDRMVEIYATYFGSTKQHDNALTGGFGLGSKSPFAYTEHFTVTSCHAGVRRIYALMISDDDTDGAPAVKLMANAPCGDAHGLTVSLPIKSEDEWQFRNEIKAVVRDGGMIVNLNGKRLPTRDYTELRKHGIGLFANGEYGVIQILYGNVLYPLTPNDSINKHLRVLENWRVSGHDLIVAATPSSVSVTPSRESLSYNPRTIASIQCLLRRALHLLNANKRKMERAAVAAFIERTAMTRATVTYAFRHQVSETDPKRAAIIGAVEIARFRAEQAIAACDYPMKKFLDQAGRYFGDKSKLLMRLVELPELLQYANGRKHRLRGVENAQEQHRFVSRKLLRVVPATLWDRLSYINRATETPNLRRLRKMSPYTGTMSTPLNLSIAYSRDAALLAGGVGYYLIAPKITDEEIAAIKAAAPMFRFKVAVLAKIAPVKKPRKVKVVKPADKYSPLDLSGLYYYSRGNGGMRVIAEPTVEKPAAYLAWAPSRCRGIGLTISENANLLFEDINEQIPGAVLAVGPRQIETLKKAGVPSVESILFARLEAHLTNDVIGCAINRIVDERKRFRTYNDHSAVELFRALLSINRRLAHAVLRLPRALPMVKHESSFATWRLARRLFETNNLKRYTATADVKTYNDLCERAKKPTDPAVAALLKKFVDQNLREKDLPHLTFFAKIINKNSLKDLSDADKTRLAKMIEAETTRLKGEPA